MQMEKHDDNYIKISPEVHVLLYTGTLSTQGTLVGYTVVKNKIYPKIKWNNPLLVDMPYNGEVFVLNKDFKLMPRQEKQYCLLGTGYSYTPGIVEEDTNDDEMNKNGGKQMIFTSCCGDWDWKNQYIVPKDKTWPDIFIPIVPVMTYLKYVIDENKKEAPPKRMKECIDYTKIMDKNTAYFVQTNQTPYVFLSINGWCIPIKGDSGPCRLNPLFVDNKVVRIFEFVDFMENGSKAKVVWEKKKRDDKLTELTARKEKLLEELKRLESEMEKHQ